MNLLSPPLIPTAVIRMACVIASALTLPLFAAEAATLWSTTFSSPPYTTNATVVGTGGWTGTLFDSENDTDAALIAYSGATGGTALRLYSTSTNPATLRQRSRIHNNFEKVEGPKVEASFSIAYDWSGSSVNGTSIYFGTSSESSPISLYFSAKDGLYLRGSYGDDTNRSILTAALAAKNSFYNFTVLFDFDARTFDLTVAGLDVNGAPVNLTFNDISFQNGTSTSMDGISTVRLVNDRGDNVAAYFDQISIASIPEGGTLGMLGGAGAVVALSSLLRRRPLR